MDRREFSSSSPGKLVPTGAASPDIQFAFVPDPLPPKWRWPERLWRLLLDARTSLASLDGTGKHLPNPEILLRPLQDREAQLSSKLEGTITDPHQERRLKQPMNEKYQIVTKTTASQHETADLCICLPWLGQQVPSGTRIDLTCAGCGCRICADPNTQRFAKSAKILCFPCALHEGEVEG